MTRLLSVVAASAILIAAAAPASALTVSNADDVDHAITLVNGKQRSESIVPAGETLEFKCEPKCTLSIGTGEDENYTVEAVNADHVTIRESGFAPTE